MTQRPIRLLVVEDSELDYLLLGATLERDGLAVVSRRVEEREAMAEALANEPWDAVIADHVLPRFSSTEAMALLAATGLPIPLIIVSGMIGEEAAVNAMRAGASDFVSKGRLARLAPALLNAMSASTARQERQRAVDALRDSEERLRDLSAHLQTAIDDERAAIAREVHDDIGGTLSALQFDLSWIERHADGPIRERCRQALDTLAQAIQAGQRLTRSLHPPVLDSGLIAALRWLLGEFRKRTGLSVRFSANAEEIVVPGPVGIAVYRTLQEALTNIQKHAAATEVRVDLLRHDGQLSLEVTDNGRGLSQDDLHKPTSFGLRGLAERARRIGGWLDVTPSPRGTTVLLSLPGEGQATPETAATDVNALDAVP